MPWEDGGKTMFLKPTFLNQSRPLITGMVLKCTPKEIITTVRNSIFDGADCLGIQLETLKNEYKTEENYKEIFSSCYYHPIYITNYRGHENGDKSDIDLAKELIIAAKCGATLCDVPGSYFDSDSGMGIENELSNKKDAIYNQQKLIEYLHSIDKEVIMSSHVLKFTNEEQVLEIAFEQKKRGADIVKIVTAANSIEEQMENLRITTVLKRELDIPFLFLSGGPYSKIHRLIGPQLGSVMYLAVKEHCETSIPTQPTIRAAKAIRDNLECLYPINF